MKFNISRSIKVGLFVYISLGFVSIFFLLTKWQILSLPKVVNLWLFLAYGYWIAVSFILAQIGFGRIIIRLPIFRNLHLNKGLGAVLQFGIGLYATILILLCLALVRGMEGPGLAIYIVFAAPGIFLGVLTIRDLFCQKDQAEKKLQPRKIDSKILIKLIIIILIVIMALPFFIQTFLPNSDWDGAAYHLPLAKRFLEGHISEVSPSFDTYNFPGNIHLIYAVFFAFGAESAIIPFNFLMALLLIFAVYTIATEIWGRRAALWAMVICTALNILWEVAITPRIDSLQAYFSFVACGVFLYWLSHRQKVGLIIFTGMMLGITLGIKYTAIFLIAVIGIFLTIILFLTFRKELKKAVTLILLLAVVLLIPSGWWYVRNVLLLGDPLYPYFSGPLFYDKQENLQEFLPEMRKLLEEMPSQSEVAAVGEEFGIPFLYRKTPFPSPPNNLLNFWDMFQHPDRYQRKSFQEINLLILLFFLLPIFSRRRESLWLFGITLAVFFFIATRSYILRYALPVLPFFALGAGVVLSKIRLRLVVFVVALIAGLTLFRFTYLEYSKLDRIKPFDYLSGKANRMEWLIETGYNSIKGMPSLIDYTNDLVDAGEIRTADIIFMVGESKGNLLKCQYLPDSSRWAIQWLEEMIKFDGNYQQLKLDFKKRGIKYILFNAGYSQGVAESYAWKREPLIFAIYHLIQFIKDHTEVVYAEDQIYLAKIN